MSGTADTEFALFDQYWCVHPKLPEPLLCTIIALTDAPGKLIGLDCGQDVGLHTCDGRTDQGHGIWINPEFIYNETEWAAVEEQLVAQAASRAEAFGSSYKRITIDADDNIVETFGRGVATLQDADEDEGFAPAHRG